MTFCFPIPNQKFVTTVEFDVFFIKKLFVFCRWFCHFDDDNYVNVPRLVSLLNEYSPTMEWYLGKPSVASPLEIHLEYVI